MTHSLLSTSAAMAMLGVGKTQFAKLSAQFHRVRYSDAANKNGTPIGKCLWRRAEIEEFIARHTEAPLMERGLANAQVSAEVMEWFREVRL